MLSWAGHRSVHYSILWLCVCDPFLLPSLQRAPDLVLCFYTLQIILCSTHAWQMCEYLFVNYLLILVKCVYLRAMSRALYNIPLLLSTFFKRRYPARIVIHRNSFGSS